MNSCNRYHNTVRAMHLTNIVQFMGYFPFHCIQKQQPWKISHSDIQFGGQDLIGTNGIYSSVSMAVYKTNDVAAKTLNSMRAGITEETLVKYAKSYSSPTIRHENIVEIFGAFITEGAWRIVMELMPTSLRKHLDDDGALGNPELMIVARGVANGLQYLHCFKCGDHEQALGLAHGGLSSNNVLLDVDSPEWKVKLSDYCLTTLRPGTDGSVSHAKAYAAPELCRNGQMVNVQMCSAQADIYSFGMILVEMNTGRVLPCTQSGSSDRVKEVKGNWEALSVLVEQCVCVAGNRLHCIQDVCEKLETLDE